MNSAGHGPFLEFLFLSLPREMSAAFSCAVLQREERVERVKSPFFSNWPPFFELANSLSLSQL